jgi:thioredoxin reductase/SAM-dependent methyltransferase
MTDLNPDPPALDQKWDVVIIGGGSAGLSAALILARARRRVLVLDGGAPRNRFAPHMHGVLGRDGYSPLQLVEDGQREVRAADGVIVTARVVGVTRTSDGFELETEAGVRIRAGRLVLATGIRDDLPAIEGLAEQWGRGAVACPYCDGFEARGKAIGVLAGSIAGLHKAQLLRAYSEDVTAFTALVGAVPEDDAHALVARGIRLDNRPIVRIRAENDTLVGIELDAGAVVPIDALFVDPTMVPLDDLLRQLGAETTETPWGRWTSTDATGATSIDGVWAIGNLANPAALVPVAMGAGVIAAATINAALVAEDIASALAVAEAPTAAEYWEHRYSGATPQWSGNPNAALVREVSGITPGTALDLGSGEGGDAVWLASAGWTVTAVDIAPSALAIGAQAADAAGVADRIEWIAADLGGWEPAGPYDLVSAQFLHSFVELPREAILRRAAAAVASAGLLLIVGHFGEPSWGSQHGHDIVLPSPEEMRAALALPEAEWEVVTSALVERSATAPDGSRGTIVDSVLAMRRR